MPERIHLGLALCCVDWRLHHPRVDLTPRLAQIQGVDSLDVIAVPGPNGLLRPDRAAEFAVVMDWVRARLSAFGREQLAIVAHQDCMGHPVSDEQHVADAMATARALKEGTGFAGPVVALVALRGSDMHWDLQQIGAC
jgi:hypothetical protein